MQLELSPETMQALAKEIARATVAAQVNGIDDFITEEVSAWPESVRREYHVPEAGLTTQAQRLETFRAVKAPALAMKARLEKEEADFDAQLERRRQERREQEARQQEQELLQYEADKAQWKAAAAASAANGAPLPPEPKAPPTAEERASRAALEFVKSEF